MLNLHPRDLTDQMPIWIKQVEKEPNIMDQNTRQKHKVGPPWICDQ